LVIKKKSVMMHGNMNVKLVYVSRTFYNKLVVAFFVKSTQICLLTYSLPGMSRIITGVVSNFLIIPN